MKRGRPMGTRIPLEQKLQRALACGRDSVTLRGGEVAFAYRSLRARTRLEALASALRHALEECALAESESGLRFMLTEIDRLGDADSDIESGGSGIESSSEKAR